MGTSVYSSDIPSQRLELIEAMIGQTLDKLIRFSRYSVEKGIKERFIEEDKFFSTTAGPLLMYLSSGLVVGVASEPSKVSILLWVEKNERGELKDKPCNSSGNLFPFDARDEADWCGFLGKTIKSVRIIHRQPWNCLAAELPCEAGLLVTFEDNSEFILSHGLHDNSDDFSIIKRAQIDPDVSRDLDL